MKQSINWHKKTLTNVGSNKKLISPIQYIIKRLRKCREIKIIQILVENVKEKDFKELTADERNTLAKCFVKLVTEFNTEQSMREAIDCLGNIARICNLNLIKELKGDSIDERLMKNGS